MINSDLINNSLFTVGIEEEYMLCNPLSFDLIPKANEIMNLINKLGRVGAILLPVALLAAFFKYLHPINSALHEIEGVGARKTALILFISFLAIWALIYVGSIFFSQVLSWVWNEKNSSPIKNERSRDNRNIENPLQNNIDYQKAKEREALFKLDLRNENAA